jgi:hypothetical protein
MTQEKYALSNTNYGNGYSRKIDEAIELIKSYGGEDGRKSTHELYEVLMNLDANGFDIDWVLKSLKSVNQSMSTCNWCSELFLTYNVKATGRPSKVCGDCAAKRHSAGRGGGVFILPESNGVEPRDIDNGGYYTVARKYYEESGANCCNAQPAHSPAC